MTSTRDRIDDRIRADPGIHVNALVRELILAPGRYSTISADWTLWVTNSSGGTHYYPPDYDAWERAALALLRRETAAEIVAVLLADGPLTASETADRVDIADSTLSWHRGRAGGGGTARDRRGPTRRPGARADGCTPRPRGAVRPRATRGPLHPLVDDLLD
ncbi:MAG: winged helix-turn-helix domain-containing protein [Halobacteriales archaeon]|nr:winged helix-turn-helix domain-containing protein [Halobacteriales archaeon]